MIESEVDQLHHRIKALLESCKQVQWNGKALAKSGVLYSYQEQVEILCRHARLESVPMLLLIAEQGVARRNALNEPAWSSYPSSQILAVLDAAAKESAQALVRLAVSQPSRELLPALEKLAHILQGSNAPLEFIPLFWQMKRALKRLNNLPIPAEAPSVSEGLPIPVEAPRIE